MYMKDDARQMHTPKAASDFQRKELSCLGRDSRVSLVFFFTNCTCAICYQLLEFMTLHMATGPSQELTTSVTGHVISHGIIRTALLC